MGSPPPGMHLKREAWEHAGSSGRNLDGGIDLPLYYGATLLLPSSSDPADGDAPGAVAALSLWAQTLGRQSAKN